MSYSNHVEKNENKAVVARSCDRKLKQSITAWLLSMELDCFSMIEVFSMRIAALYIAGRARVIQDLFI